MAARRGHGAQRRCVAASNAAPTTSDTDGAAFSPDETMFGGSLSLRRAIRRTRQRLRHAGARLQGGRFQHRRRRCRPTAASFDTETLHSLELGMRASNADESLAGDVALFYMRRKDQQVPTGEQLEPGNPLSFVLYTDNAARGENYGLEGTLRWRPSPALLLDLRGRDARDAVSRLRIRRTQPRWPRAGACSAISIRSRPRISRMRAGCSRASISPGSTTSTSMPRTMSVHRRESSLI